MLAWNYRCKICSVLVLEENQEHRHLLCENSATQFTSKQKQAVSPSSIVAINSPPCCLLSASQITLMVTFTELEPRTCSCLPSAEQQNGERLLEYTYDFFFNKREDDLNSWCIVNSLLNTAEIPLPTVKSACTHTAVIARTQQ